MLPNLLVAFLSFALLINGKPSPILGFGETFAAAAAAPTATTTTPTATTNTSTETTSTKASTTSTEASTSSPSKDSTSPAPTDDATSTFCKCIQQMRMLPSTCNSTYQDKAASLSRIDLSKSLESTTEGVKTKSVDELNKQASDTASDVEKKLKELPDSSQCSTAVVVTAVKDLTQCIGLHAYPDVYNSIKNSNLGNLYCSAKSSKDGYLLTLVLSNCTYGSTATPMLSLDATTPAVKLSGLLAPVAEVGAAAAEEKSTKTKTTSTQTKTSTETQTSTETKTSTTPTTSA